MTNDMSPQSAASWFDELYQSANRDPRAIPWANLTPNPWVVEWVASRSAAGRAVVVGCGLGDDAELVAGAGHQTTAFDVSAHAVEWCGARFPESGVDYSVADLLDLPGYLVGGFDMVVEVRTIQSLPPTLRDEAIDSVASLLAPGGSALIVALARPDGTIPNGPPWAVSAEELKRFGASGLQLTNDLSNSSHHVLELSRDDR